MVPDDEVKQATPTTSTPSKTTKVTAKPQDDLSKLLEEIED